MALLALCQFMHSNCVKCMEMRMHLCIDAAYRSNESRGKQLESRVLDMQHELNSSNVQRISIFQLNVFSLAEYIKSSKLKIPIRNQWYPWVHGHCLRYFQLAFYLFCQHERTLVEYLIHSPLNTQKNSLNWKDKCSRSSKHDLQMNRISQRDIENMKQQKGKWWKKKEITINTIYVHLLYLELRSFCFYITHWRLFHKFGFYIKLVCFRFNLKVFLIIFT